MEGLVPHQTLETVELAMSVEFLGVVMEGLSWLGEMEMNNGKKVLKLSWQRKTHPKNLFL